MTAKRADIERWFDKGKAEGAAYMIVLRENFNNDNWPVYVMPDQDIRAEILKGRGEGVYLEEVYDLYGPREYQLTVFRCRFEPGGSTQKAYREHVTQALKDLESKRQAEAANLNEIT